MLLGVGQAMGFATLFAAAGSGVPVERQGVASALMSTIQQIGTALGLAALIGVAAWVTAASAGSEMTAAADGLRAATWTGAGVLAAGSLLTALLMPRTAAQRS